MKETWSFVQWPKTLGKEKFKFSVKEVKIDANEELQWILIKYDDNEIKLPPRHKSGLSSFEGEKPIYLKTKFEEQYDITLTGCLTNETFNSKLVGKMTF